MCQRKISDAMRERIREVGRKQKEAKRLALQSRQLLKSLPTSKQLAYDAGVGVRRVQELIAATRNSIQNDVPCGTFRGTPDEVAEAVIREYGLDGRQ